jgi:hypothetical protein
MAALTTAATRKEHPSPGSRSAPICPLWRRIISARMYRPSDIVPFADAGDVFKLLDDHVVHFFQSLALLIVKRMLQEIFVRDVAGRHIAAAAQDDGIILLNSYSNYQKLK